MGGQFRRQALTVGEQQALGEDRGQMHLDALGGQGVDDPAARRALIQNIAGDLHHVGLEAASDQGRAVLDRGDEADLAKDAAFLERLQAGP